MEQGREKALALENLDYETTIAKYKKEVTDKKTQDALIEQAEKEHQKNLDKIEKDYQMGPTFESFDMNVETPGMIQARLEADYKEELYKKSAAFARELLKEQLDDNLISQSEYNDRVAELDAELKQQRNENFSQYADATMSILGSMNTVANNLANSQLQKDEADNNQKKDALKKRLDSGALDQDSYNKQVAALDADLDLKKKEIALKQAKREKALAALAIGINTAQAIMKIWADIGGVGFGIPAGILTAIVAATGAAQLAAVLTAPMPGFKGGYYNVSADTGNFRALNGGFPRTQLVDKPTVFLAGEQGKHFPEMIVDGPTYNFAKMNYPGAIDAIFESRNRVKGYASGSYPDASPGGLSNDMAKQLISILNKIDQEGVAVSYSKMETATSEVTNIRNAVSGN